MDIFKRIKNYMAGSLLDWFVKFFKRNKAKKEYDIIFTSSQFELSNLVNKNISEGWEIVGGAGYMAVKTGGNQYDHKQNDLWFQAMMRET